MLKNFKIIFPIIGAVCLLIPKHVVGSLPYLLGVSMLMACASFVYSYVKNHDDTDRFSENLSFGFMMGIMGVFFLIEGQKSLGAIGTTWAIIGIIKASRSLELLIKALRNHRGWSALAFEFCVRLGLALLLLFDPFEHITAHIAILGLELIFSQIKFTKSKR